MYKPEQVVAIKKKPARLRVSAHRSGSQKYGASELDVGDLEGFFAVGQAQGH